MKVGRSKVSRSKGKPQRGRNEGRSRRVSVRKMHGVPGAGEARVLAEGADVPFKKENIRRTRKSFQMLFLKALSETDI